MNYLEFNEARTSPTGESTSWDVIDFDEPMHEGIEVREHASLGEFLRELQLPQGK